MCHWRFMPHHRPHCSHKMGRGRTLKGGDGVSGKMRGLGCCNIEKVWIEGTPHTWECASREGGWIVTRLCGAMCDESELKFEFLE